MTIFGTIRTDDEVEEAVVSTLRLWLPTYFSEVERQLGLDPGYYARPVESSYTSRADFDKFPEEQLPLVVVVSAGIEDDPPVDGKGRYRGVYQIGVVNVVSAMDQMTTRRYAQRMAAAIRAVLVQKQSLDLALDQSVRGVDFVGSRNNELPSEDDRTIWACRQAFNVEVGDIVSRNRGPIVVPSDPDTPVPDPPTVDDVVVDIDKEPIA